MGEGRNCNGRHAYPASQDKVQKGISQGVRLINNETDVSALSDWAQTTTRASDGQSSIEYKALLPECGRPGNQGLRSSLCQVDEVRME